MAILNNESGKYAGNFVQMSPGPAMDPQFKAIYDKFAKRIIWMDGGVCPGAFQMNTAWYFNVPERDPIFEEHCHSDTSELVGFFSGDKDNPYDLGGKIEFTIDGEAHLLTKSTSPPQSHAHPGGNKTHFPFLRGHGREVQRGQGYLQMIPASRA